MGHATTTITLNRYVHASFELKRENMNKLIGNAIWGRYTMARKNKFRKGIKLCENDTAFILGLFYSQSLRQRQLFLIIMHLLQEEKRWELVVEKRR